MRLTSLVLAMLALPGGPPRPAPALAPNPVYLYLVIPYTLTTSPPWPMAIHLTPPTGAVSASYTVRWGSAAWAWSEAHGFDERGQPTDGGPISAVVTFPLVRFRAFVDGVVHRVTARTDQPPVHTAAAGAFDGAIDGAGPSGHTSAVSYLVHDWTSIPFPPDTATLELDAEAWCNIVAWGEGSVACWHSAGARVLIRYDFAR